MKRALVLLCCALALPSARAGLDRAAFIGLSASVLKVEGLRVQGGYALGSGVVVDTERVVTNCHVTRDARQVFVLRGEVRWRATAQLVDAAHDLCLLEVPGLRAQPVTLGPLTGPALGQPVTAIGYTGGLSLQSSDGAVLGLHRLDGGNVIRSSNWFSSGASGGGLFDARLRLVGVLTFRLRGGEAHYYSAPAAWLQHLVDLPSDAYRPLEQLPAEPLAYWQRPIAEQPRFLQAALLDRDGHWSELDRLSAEWVRIEPDDAEPWYLLGRALEHQDRLPEAQQAFECSLRLQPAFEAASLELASLEKRRTTQAPAASVATRSEPCPTATRHNPP